MSFFVLLFAFFPTIFCANTFSTFLTYPSFVSIVSMIDVIFAAMSVVLRIPTALAHTVQTIQQKHHHTFVMLRRTRCFSQQKHLSYKIHSPLLKIQEILLLLPLPWQLPPVNLQPKLLQQVSGEW